MRKTVENRLFLQQSLYMFRMTESKSKLSHLDKFDLIIMDLEDIDSKIDNENQTLLLLCSFPQSFKYFHNTKIYGKEIILYRKINSALKFKEQIDRDIMKKINGG